MTKSVASRQVRATRAESTRFDKDLGALSGCGTPTNVLVARYRRGDYACVGICGQGLLAAQQIHSPSSSQKTRGQDSCAMGSARDQNHREAEMQSMTIDSAAIGPTDTILGEGGPDLEQTLKAIAANIGVLHIAYAPLGSQKSEGANLVRAICTYPVAWQARYFKKQYARIDPVIARGSEAILPFDWDELPKDDLATQAFFDDAADHDVGRNGLSIPVRNRKGVRSLVSFTSNHSKDDWAEYKSRNMIKLQPMAVLIDSAAAINFKLTPEPVELVQKRGGMSDLGGARQDISRHRRTSESVVRQRKGVSGYGAP